MAEMRPMKGSVPNQLAMGAAGFFPPRLLPLAFSGPPHCSPASPSPSSPPPPILSQKLLRRLLPGFQPKHTPIPELTGHVWGQP